MSLIHELDFWITNHTGPAGVRRLLNHTTHFVAGSQAVRDNLVRNLGVEGGRIDIVRECIPVREWQAKCLEWTPNASDFRASLGISPDDFVVGAAGTTDWRKAPDLFVQLAYLVRKQNARARIKFLWVGGDRAGRDHARLMHDVKLAGLSGQVLFLGARADYLRVLSCFDVFCLVSREDSFPLVVLESALLGRPTICFDRAGGVPEFIEDDAGIIVPYLDLNAMADAVGRLHADPVRRSALGERARKRVVERHDVEVTAPQMLESIQRVLFARVAASNGPG